MSEKQPDLLTAAKGLSKCVMADTGDKITEGMLCAHVDAMIKATEKRYAECDHAIGLFAGEIRFASEELSGVEQDAMKRNGFAHCPKCGMPLEAKPHG